MRKPSTLAYLKNIRALLLCAVLLALSACTPDVTTPGADYPTWDGQTLFEPVAPATTGIDFANTLAYDEEFNIYKYRNFYNGGGVAIGDVNKDGLTDIYFSGNRVSNRLYLNRGDFNFEDATEAAGVGGK
ncbi:MAG: FG-GAP repeat domain-containing protein, partial [Lewinella sp.]